MFGSKFLSSLVAINIDFKDYNPPLKQVIESIPMSTPIITTPIIGLDHYESDNEIENEMNTNENNKYEIINDNLLNYIRNSKITGYVSKAGIGVGRSDNDRQFIYVNNRPVELLRFIKSLNEVWRRYELKNKPAFIINIEVPCGSFDINLSPDKREIVLIHENILLDYLIQEIDKIYSPSRNTFSTIESLLTAPSSNNKTKITNFVTPNNDNIISNNTSSTTKSNQTSQNNINNNNSNESMEDRLLNSSISWITPNDIENSQNLLSQPINLSSEEEIVVRKPISSRKRKLMESNIKKESIWEINEIELSQLYSSNTQPSIITQTKETLNGTNETETENGNVRILNKQVILFL